MEFTVPQFIEEETKIIGPLSFRQIIFIGIAVGICIFLYFSVNFILFIVLSFFSLGIGVSLALIKINKTQLPVYIKNLFIFKTKTKIYLWRKSLKKEIPVSLKEKNTIEDLSGKKSNVNLIRKSKIQDLFTQISSKK